MFEYKVICGWRTGNSIESVEEELNRLAKENWRVVCCGDETIILSRVSVVNTNTVLVANIKDRI